MMRNEMSVMMSWFVILLASSSWGLPLDDDSGYAGEHQDILRIAQSREDMTEEERSAVMMGLVEKAEAVKKKYSETHVEMYGQLTNDICGKIQGMRLEDKSKYYWPQQLAMKALESRAGMSEETQAMLVMHVVREVDAEGNDLTGEARIAKRQSQARLWLETWKRIEDAIDPNWDSMDVPYMNVPLPKGVSGISGMDPEMIQDAEQRAKYQAAIEANRRKGMVYHVQSTLRDLRKWWERSAKIVLIHKYMNASDEEKVELGRMMTEYGVDEASRALILKGIAEKKLPDELLSKQRLAKNGEDGASLSDGERPAATQEATPSGLVPEQEKKGEAKARGS